MIYDISPLVDARLAVWPGDTPPVREVLSEVENGDAVTLSTLRATVHLGAHADAPSHYASGAASIEDRPLEPYLGPCEVVRLSPERGERVVPGDMPGPPRADRVLIATGTFPDPARFNEDFAALSAELMLWLADHGVRLVGLDTPSVDLFSSKDLPAHKAALERDLALLEGVVLDGVPEGVYELIALPLRLHGFDASPVRAVLRSI